MPEQRYSVRLGATNGAQVREEFRQVGETGDQAMKRVLGRTNQTNDALEKFGRGARRVGRESSGATHGIRSLSLQLNQVAQQGAITGDFLSAFAFQLPDILLAFGTAGVLAGVAAGALTPFVTGLLEVEDSGERAADTLSALEQATEDYARAAETSIEPMDELIAKYGDLAEAVRRAQIAETEAARDRAVRAVVSATEVLEGSNPLAGFSAAQIAGIDAAERRAEEMFAQIERLQNSLTSDQARFFDFTADLREIEILRERVGDIRAGVAELADTFGIPEGAARNLAVAFAQVGDAATGSTREQVRAAEALRDALVEAYGSIGAADEATEGLASAANRVVVEAARIAGIDLGLFGDAATTAADLTREIGDAAVAALELAGVDITGPISDAQKAAAELAGDLGIALADAYSLQNLRSTGIYSGRGGDPRQFENGPTYQSDVAYTPIDEIIEQFNRRKRRGGGGRSDAQKEHNEALREAESIFEATRTEAEQYADELARLEELQNKGYISADTFNRAVADLDGGFASVALTLGDVRDAAAETFSDIVVGAENAAEAVSNLLRSFAGSLIQSAFTSGIDALFPSIGFNARGTDFWRGGLTWVGEEGPELVNLPRGSQVYPSDVSTSMATGTVGPVSVHVSVDARGAQEGVASQITRALAGIEQRLGRVVEGHVQNAVKRGRLGRV